MREITKVFATPLYHAPLTAQGDVDLPDIKRSCWSIAQDDEAGQNWCMENGYPGYTSYASLTDLGWRFSVFSELEKLLDLHVAQFVRELDWDLEDKAITLEDLWINILPEGGTHSGHIHPHSVISGTTYIAMPEDASAIRFEDPRLPQMMAAPPRRKNARGDLRPFVFIAPRVGDVILWESWLRHEVPVNMSEEERISVSFNYRWG